jgi:hypothetical protein
LLILSIYIISIDIVKSYSSSWAGIQELLQGVGVLDGVCEIFWVAGQGLIREDIGWAYWSLYFIDQVKGSFYSLSICHLY